MIVTLQVQPPEVRTDPLVLMILSLDDIEDHGQVGAFKLGFERGATDANHMCAYDLSDLQDLLQFQRLAARSKLSEASVVEVPSQFFEDLFVLDLVVKQLRIFGIDASIQEDPDLHVAGGGPFRKTDSDLCHRKCPSFTIRKESTRLLASIVTYLEKDIATTETLPLFEGPLLEADTLWTLFSVLNTRARYEWR